MNIKAVLVAIAGICVVTPLGEARQLKSANPHRFEVLQKGTTSRSESDPLGRAAGEWEVEYVIVAAENVSLGTGDTTVSQPSKDAISFSLSFTVVTQSRTGAAVIPRMNKYEYEFSLKRGAQPTRYLLSIKSEDGLVIEDFTLSYSKETGFVGDGVGLIGGRPVKVSVKITEDSGEGLIWSVKEQREGSGEQKVA